LSAQPAWRDRIQTICGGRFLQAYDEGEGTLEALAEQFRVSLGWAKKISARRTRTGAMDAPVWRHGPESRVTAAVQQWMRERVGEQPDLTLRELQQRLEEAKHLRLSIGRIWLALRQIGLPLKKNRSTLRSKTVGLSPELRQEVKTLLTIR
jgi:transposase